MVICIEGVGFIGLGIAWRGLLFRLNWVRTLVELSTRSFHTS